MPRSLLNRTRSSAVWCRYPQVTSAMSWTHLGAVRACWLILLVTKAAMSVSLLRSPNFALLNVQLVRGIHLLDS